MKFELILRNVKVEYPSLYEARGSIAVLLHLEKHVEEIAAIRNIVKITKAENKKLRRSATCLVGPSNTSWCPAEHLLLSCTALPDKQIVVLDRDMSLMTLENNKIMGGSVCNVKVQITTDDVNIYATVLAVQYVHAGCSCINRTGRDSHYQSYKIGDVDLLTLSGFKNLNCDVDYGKGDSISRIMVLLG